MCIVVLLRVVFAFGSVLATRMVLLIRTIVVIVGPVSVVIFVMTALSVVIHVVLVGSVDIYIASLLRKGRVV